MKNKILVVALFLSNAVCYVDRVNISVAAVAMRDELGWSSSEQGIVLGSFFVGYAIMQIPAGILSTKFGGRNVLCVAMIGWGSMTLLTPVSASLGFYPLLCCRAIMGMFEALAIPSIHALIGERIPKNERSRVVSISTAGQYVGCVIALSSSPLVSWKWSSVFYLFGAISILYVIFLVRIIPASFSKENTFSPLTNNGDDDDGGNNLNNNNKIELVTIESKYLVPSSFITSNNDNSKTNTTSLHDVFAALMYKPFLAVVVCHVAHNYGYYVLLSWLPTYFNDELDVDITHVGLAALSPYIFSAIADISFGHVVDYLIEVKGFTRTFARKLAQILAFLIPSAMLLSLSLFRISSLFAAVALLCVALSTNTLSHSGYWSNIVDIDPDRAGFLCGISNFFATLPGIYGNSLTGYILGGGGGTWSDVFLVTIIHWSVGLIFYAVFARAEIWVRT